MSYTKRFKLIVCRNRIISSVFYVLILNNLLYMENNRESSLVIMILNLFIGYMFLKHEDFVDKVDSSKSNIVEIENIVFEEIERINKFKNILKIM